jgi:hypothetical protein
MTCVTCSDGSYYHAPDHFLLFSHLNVAKCAAERARTGACFQYDDDGTDRFGREYDTARMWTRHSEILCRF